MRRLTFFSDERFSFLDPSAKRSVHANVGADGRNLTVVILSLNRVHLTIRLLQSFKQHAPHFGGRFLIADNGSASDQLTVLEEFCATQLQMPYRILKFGQNFGVGGGRNRAFAEVETDWIMSLDNDIFITANPFAHLSRDIDSLGCHFLSFPLVNPDLKTFYSFGGHLQPAIHDGEPAMGFISMLTPGTPISEADHLVRPGEAFLCSFLYGGASILQRDSFLAAGGFDDAMLVGFEDIDFSLRLWRAGMKVGSSAISCFVHDHPPPESDDDRDYARRRFSRNALHDSARHLEAKYGFRFWSDAVDCWLQNREAAAGGVALKQTEADIQYTASKQERLPRIALVTDTADWAFANISRQIIRHLGDKYEFDLIPVSKFGEIEEARWLETGAAQKYLCGGGAEILQLLLLAPEYDQMHFFWRDMLTLIDSGTMTAYANRLGIDDAKFRRDYLNKACLTTSVYDHLHCTPDAIAERAAIFNRWTVGYTVSSARLYYLYSSMPGIRPPTAVIADGVDPNLFYPLNLDRLSAAEGREIILGWVGNSRWAASTGDPKGVHTILIPAVEQLRAEGVPIRLELADRQNGFIPHDQMVHWYSTIDVYVCTSEIEGTPNPVLEAMACGVPVVSTDVGIVPEAFGPLQTAFILKDRSIESLQAALRQLASEPSLLRRLSDENLEKIRGWHWQAKTAEFDAFFSATLERRQAARGECRTKICTLPFTTPSMETDGSIRLCSASSIFAYRDETNMGNCRTDGLKSVWRNEKYRAIRASLISAENLTPYCDACEYRFDGPAWLLQLHLALHAWQSGLRDDEMLTLLRRRADRYAEYAAFAPSVGLPVLPLPALSDEEGKGAGSPLDPPTIPEALIDGGDLPINMDFNTLNRCNVSCIMCPPAIRFDEHGVRQDPYYRLTLDEFNRIVAGVKLTSAHFVGAYAEPLLNKEIFDLIKTAHDCGAFTAITTNAMALSRSFAQRLIDAGLDMISISLHGATQETAQSIMRKSNFDTVIANICDLQDVKAKRGIQTPEVYFNFVSQLANVHEIADFIDLAAKLNVRYVNIIHLIDGDEAVDKGNNLLNYPELLAPQLLEARQRATRQGIHLAISPAYAHIEIPASIGIA